MEKRGAQIGVEHDGHSFKCLALSIERTDDQDLWHSQLPRPHYNKSTTLIHNLHGLPHGWWHFYRNPNKFPNGSWTKVYWPVHSALNREYLTLNLHNKSRGNGFRARKCAFWNYYLPNLLGEYNSSIENICIYPQNELLPLQKSSRLIHIMFHYYCKTRHGDIGWYLGGLSTSPLSCLSLWPSQSGKF